MGVTGCLYRIFPGLPQMVIPMLLIVSALLAPSRASAELMAPDATSNSVTLNWTAPGDDGNTGTATTYDIRYSTTVITEGYWSSATQAGGEPSPKAAGSQESFVVDGLTPNTTYYFAIKAGDEVPNWSTLSNILTVTTEPAQGQEAPATISDLLAVDPTSTTVTLTWTAPGADGHVGTASLYDIRYSAEVADWDGARQVTGEPSPQPAGSSESFTVIALQPGTVYFFAIKTGDEVPNWSGISNLAAAVTVADDDQTAPGAITDLVASPGVSIGEIDIVWTAPGDDGNLGTADHYVIKASNLAITESNWNSVTTMGNPPSPLAAGSHQSWTLTGLTPGQLYYVAVKAVDESGNPADISNVPAAVAQWTLSLDVDDDPDELPARFHLAQNYPNPFNPNTTIAYSLPRASRVRLSVYNVAGRLVTILVDETQSAGNHFVDWNGTDADHAPVASGVYFYRLDTGEYSESQKMVLLK